MTWCKTTQERESIVTALPKRKSSCITPNAIAKCYMLCMYLKEGNIQHLAYGNKHTLRMLFSSFGCSTWQLHMTTLGCDMVVSRIAMCSVWGHLCIHSCSYSQSGICLNWLGQVHPRSVAYQTTEWHQRWMCHVFLAVTLQHSSLSSWSSSHLHGTAELPDLENSFSVRAYHTFQVKGWCFGLICFINHGALHSRNELELILEKTKLYLGIALCRQYC